MTVCLDNNTQPTLTGKRKVQATNNNSTTTAVKKSQKTKHKKTKKGKKEKTAVPLAKQSECVVMHASSTHPDCVHPLESLLLVEKEKESFWEAKNPNSVTDNNNNGEEFVQFQLHPQKELRRIGGVEVHVSNFSVNFRVDYSVDGTTWKQGYSLPGMASCGIRSSFGFPPPLLARYVRVVCEKPTAGDEEEIVDAAAASGNSNRLGFKAVEFNRVAQMFESRGWNL